jgi:hypothetical protein
LLRVFVQKVDSLVSFQFHPAHRTAAYIVFPDRRAVSGASAGPDVVHRQSAARFPASFREPVRDSPWASAERARRDALQPRQVPQPPAAQKKVEFPTEFPAVARLVAAHWALRSVVPRVMADEWV